MKGLVLSLALIVAASAVQANTRQRTVINPVATPLIWQVAVFSSPQEAYTFAVTRTTRVTVQTNETAPRYVVFSTVTGDGGRDNEGPFDFGITDDSGAALWLYHSKHVATKGVATYGATWIVWWSK